MILYNYDNNELKLMTESTPSILFIQEIDPIDLQNKKFHVTEADRKPEH